jgi:hypothetical protein
MTSGCRSEFRVAAAIMNSLIAKNAMLPGKIPRQRSRGQRTGIGFFTEAR